MTITLKSSAGVVRLHCNSCDAKGDDWLVVRPGPPPSDEESRTIAAAHHQQFHTK